MQRSSLILLSAFAAALFVPAPAGAVVGAPDNVPAATLLVPYFEVDLDDANGPQTRLSIFNVYETAELARVQLWTEYGNPSFGFNVYLGGRDSVDIDLRLVFNGVLPQTGPALSGNGPHSASNVAFPSCNVASSTVSSVTLPIPALLSDEQIAYMRNAHTGQPVPELGNRCMSQPGQPTLARGYVTIDTVSGCALLAPHEPGYFVGGGNGVASNRNSLAGSFTILDRGAGQYPTSPMVHIEASGTDAQTSTPGSHTFYGTLVAASAADNREALGAVWDVSVYSSTFFDAGTELLVWRDRGNMAQMTTGTSCNSLPPQFPLLQTEVGMFDEQEDVVALNALPPPPNPPLPLVTPFKFATQKTHVGEFFPWESGFLRMNLTTAVPGNPYGDDRLQSFVLMRHARYGQFGGFVPAMRVHGVNEQFIPIYFGWL